MMWKNICQYIFLLFYLRSKCQYLKKYIFLYTNHKNQNGKFLWLDKTFVAYSFASFMALKTKTERFYSLIKLIRHLFLLSCFVYGFKNQTASFP